MIQPLPLLLDAASLSPHLGEDDLLIIDLSKPETYAEGHIPGAINVSPKRLLCNKPPVPNKVPSAAQLSELFSEIGLTPQTRVVVYDDEMGPWAGRLIWTLDLLGHPYASLVDGQLAAWKADGGPLETRANEPKASRYEAVINPARLATLEDIQAHLGDPGRVIWDARTAAEYSGEKVVNAQKGGHIPGAVHLEWLETMRGDGDNRLKDHDTLAALLKEKGIPPEQEVITHCQSHRRSGLTYVVAKALGYDNIRCYDGSWFEWGNHPDTTVEH